MKILRFFLGIILSFSLMFIVLVTSIEIAAYSDFSFYEKEYKKYQANTLSKVERDYLKEIKNIETKVKNSKKGGKE